MSSQIKTEKPVKYNPFSMLLHWLILVAIIFAFGIAVVMNDIPGFTPGKVKLYSYHKWLGVSIFVLVIVRLAWRLVCRPPVWPVQMSWLTRLLAGAGHAALYLLLFLVPVVGYLYSQAAGVAVVWFGIIRLPTLIDADPLLKPVLKDLHVWLAWTLAVFITGHACIALKHHFWNRDDILSRMVPFLKSLAASPKDIQ